MKATGIIRRMDDLGRVVIPKEIRRTLRLREGDPLELYLDNQGGIVFRKYNAMGDYDADLVKEVCKSGLNDSSFAIYDRDGERRVWFGETPEEYDIENDSDLHFHSINYDGECIGFLYSAHANAECVAKMVAHLFC